MPTPAKTSHPIPKSVILGIVLAFVLDTLIQILWKLAISGIPDDTSLSGILKTALSNPYFYLPMLALAAQLVNWIRVLGHADLSFAQPMTALGYISVLAVSAHSLHESISVFKIIGISLIFLGVFYISRTPHVSVDPATLS